jgi:hypothetical protein
MASEVWMNLAQDLNPVTVCGDSRIEFLGSTFTSYLARKGHAYLRQLVAGFPQRWPGFDPRSSNVGFVVNKVALGQVFSKYFDIPCQSSFHQLLHSHHHLSSGAGTIGQLVADVPSGFSLTPPEGTKEIKKKDVVSYRKDK